MTGPATWGRTARRILPALLLTLACLLEASAGAITVRSGDTLYKIASRELGDGNRWKELAQLNGLTESSRLNVGQVLKLPGAAPALTPAATVPALSVAAGVTVSTALAGDDEPISGRVKSLVLTDTTGEALTLDEALGIAVLRNLTLLSGRLDPTTAQANLDLARAGYDPTLSFSAEHEWSKTAQSASPSALLWQATNTTYTAGVGQTLPAGTQYDLSLSGTRTASDLASTRHGADLVLSVTQPLFKGRGRDAGYATVTAAEQSLIASRKQTERLLNTTMADVEEAYWSLARAEEAERVAQASLTLAESILARNEQLLAQQLTSAVEVLTARSGVASRRTALIAARMNRLGEAENLLFAVFGEEVAKRRKLPRTVTPPPTVAMPGDPVVLEQQALARREDVVAARAGLEAARLSLGSAANGLLPDIDLTGSVGTGGTAGAFGDHYSDLMSNEEPSWSVGAVMTVPLGKREDKARHSSAQAAYERSRLALASTENAVRKEVRDAYRAVVLGRQKLEAAVLARQLAEERLVAEERRFEFGLGDTMRVLDNEVTAAAAFLAEVQAQFDLATAAVQLRTALGEKRILVRERE